MALADRVSRNIDCKICVLGGTDNQARTCACGCVITGLYQLDHDPCSGLGGSSLPSSDCPLAVGPGGGLVRRPGLVTVSVSTLVSNKHQDTSR